MYGDRKSEHVRTAACAGKSLNVRKSRMSVELREEQDGKILNVVVIFTDKTGTLTENRMTLRKVVSSPGEHELMLDNLGQQQDRAKPAEAKPEDPLLHRALEIGVLCNGASLGGGHARQLRSNGLIDVRRCGLDAPTAVLAHDLENEHRSFSAASSFSSSTRSVGRTDHLPAVAPYLCGRGAIPPPPAPRTRAQRSGARARNRLVQLIP